MDSDIKIGVVTVSYNSSDVITPFIECILSQTYCNLSLYIIDNASVDNTLEKIIPYASDPRLTIIKNPQNIGVAAGNNRGIEVGLQAGCDYILLINNDTEFEPELIEKLLDGMTKFNCQITVPKIMYHDDQSKIWFAGGKFIPWKGYITSHNGVDQKDHGQFDTIEKIAYAPTCCMLIKSNVFESVGLMDEKYFVYYDDADFCMRALRKGITMLYIPDCKFTHKVSSLTGGTTSEFTRRYMMRNLVYYLKKNSTFCKSAFWLIGLQMVLLLKLIARRDSIQMFALKQSAFLEGLKIKVNQRSVEWK